MDEKFSKEIHIVGKNLEMLEMKNSTNEIKNMVESITNRLNHTEPK
jgi:hypothetical protein